MPRRVPVDLIELGPGAIVRDYDGREKTVSGEDRALVALADGAEVGFLIFRPVETGSALHDGAFVHLYSAWVMPEMRRRGVFGQMGRYLIDRYPGYRIHGYGVDDYGAIRRFLKRAS